MIRRPLSRWSCRGFRASSPSSRPSRSKSATDGTSSVAISPRRGAMPSNAVPSSTGCAPSSPKATRRSSATAVSAAISRLSRPSTSPSTKHGSPRTRALTGSMCCAPTPSSPRFRSCCAIATYCGSSSCSARPRPCLPLAQSTTAATWPFAATCSAPSLPCCSDRKSTRLNSSHLVISYAVFCLKKKKHKQTTTHQNEKKRPPCIELPWAYCNHQATYFASYLTGGDCEHDDQNEGQRYL